MAGSKLVSVASLASTRTILAAGAMAGAAPEVVMVELVRMPVCRRGDVIVRVGHKPDPGTGAEPRGGHGPVFELLQAQRAAGLSLARACTPRRRGSKTQGVKPRRQE